MEELATEFMALFEGLSRAHGHYTVAASQNTVKVKGRALTVKKPVTTSNWVSHLVGKKGLGIVPIREDSRCLWAALDIDVYENFDVAEYAKELQDWPFVVCRTKSGGAHLYVFFSEPLPAKTVRKHLTNWSVKLGHSGCEVFPKQDFIQGREDVGNWINMPYFDAELTTRYAMDPETGKALSPAEFLRHAESRKLGLSQLEAFEPPVEEDCQTFVDGPPCLQLLAKEGFPEGSRNHALFSMGVYYRKRFPNDWEERVFQANNRWLSGTFSEVQGIVKSLSKKTYAYKCSDQPLVNICDKAECKRREFGIPSGARTKEEQKKKRPCILDEVDRPVKCFVPPEGSADDPQWVFNIGGKPLDVSVDMIRDQRAFLRAILARFLRLLLPVDDQRWANDMNDILHEAEQVDLPSDAGPEGQLWLHIESFCTGKVQAKDRSELIVGKPWLDKGYHWIRSTDLMKYLDQQRFREYKERQIWAILRRANAQHENFMIKGRCIAAWGIAEFKQQDEGFEMPSIPSSEEPY